VDRPTLADEFLRAVAVAIADAPRRLAQDDAECDAWTGHAQFTNGLQPKPTPKNHAPPEGGAFVLLLSEHDHHANSFEPLASQATACTLLVGICALAVASLAWLLARLELARVLTGFGLYDRH
jgi:hypothetical protein